MRGVCPSSTEVQLNVAGIGWPPFQAYRLVGAFFMEDEVMMIGKKKTRKRNFGRSRKEFEVFLSKVRHGQSSIASISSEMNNGGCVFDYASSRYRRHLIREFRRREGLKNLPDEPRTVEGIYRTVLVALSRSFNGPCRDWCNYHYEENCVFNYFEDWNRPLLALRPYTESPEFAPPDALHPTLMLKSYTAASEIAKHRKKVSFFHSKVPLEYNLLIQRHGSIPRSSFDTLCYLVRCGQAHPWLLNYVLTCLRDANTWRTSKQFDKLAKIVHDVLSFVFTDGVPDKKGKIIERLTFEKIKHEFFADEFFDL